MRLLAIVLLLFSHSLTHAFESFSYSGRLVNSNGSPIAGNANLTFDLVYTNDLTNILCTKDLNGVSLSNGVFHVKLDFTCPLETIISGIPTGQSIAIRVTDRTPSTPKVYSYQTIHSLPFSFMSQLSRQLVQMGAADGQILTWDNTALKWVPKNPVGTGNGTLTEIIAGTGLSGGTITSSGTIAIADGGVNTTQLTDSAVTSSKILDSTIVNADISPTANIAQSKIQNLVSDLAAKQDAVASGSTAQYWRGDKSWQNMDASVRSALLFGYSIIPSMTGLSDGDTIQQALGKLEGQIIANDAAFDGSGQWGKSGALIYYTGGNVGIGTASPSVSLEVKGEIRITGSTSGYVGLAPAVAGGSVTYVLPSMDGTSGQTLTTNGSGNLSWSNPSTNSSQITDGSIIDADISPTANIDQSKIANLTSDLAAKEALIIGSDNTKFWDGTKSWQSFEPKVLATDLAGLSPLAGAVTSTDTILSALEKLIGNQGSYLLKSGGTMSGDIAMGGNRISGLGNPTSDDDATTKFYVDDLIDDITSSQWTTNGLNIHFTTGNVGIGVLAPEAKMHLVGDALIDGQIKVRSSSGNEIAISAPGALASDLSLVLPGNTGSAGYALTTNGAGVLSWSAVATSASAVGGDISGTVASATINNNTIDSAKLIDGTIVDADISNTAAISQTKIAGLSTSLGNKQDLITASDSTKYYRGDKTWQTLNTDAVPQGANLYFTEPLVRGTDLAGFASGAGTISATDTILSAINKLDGNISAASSAQSNYILRNGTSAITGDLTLSNRKIINLADPTLAQDAATKAYVDIKATAVASQWTTSGSNIFYNTGNVGIGTGNPGAKLHVLGEATFENNLNSGSSSSLNFYKTRNYTASQANDEFGYLSFYGHDGTSIKRSAYIISRGDGAPTSGSVPGNLVFLTTPALGTDSLERLRITASGNIGINNSNPLSTLDVKGTIRLSGATSGYVGLAPAPTAGTTTYILPSADGSNGHLLKTNGAGVLSWIAPPSTEPTGNAGGDLSGTYPNPTISALAATKIAGGTVDNTEFGYLNGVTSNIQTQLNAKQATITAGATTDYWRGDKTWQNFDAAARGALLFGYSVTAGTVASGDSIQTALGKLDGNILALASNGQWNKSGNDISYSAGRVGIGTSSPNTSSVLDISSTTQGFLPPRMTEAQKNAISSPTMGLTIYNTSTATLQIYNGSGWYTVGQNIPNGAIMAFASATCPTGWTEYTPAYGRFLRGIDKSGSAIDPSGLRAAGSLQNQDWKGFSMTNTIQGQSAGYSHGPVDMGKSTSSFIGNLFTGKWENPSASIGVMWNAADEVRPKNAAVLYCSFSGTVVPLAPSATEMVVGNTKVSVSDTGTDGKISLITEGAEAMTITPNGRVGIGTTSPTALLHTIQTGNSTLAKFQSTSTGNSSITVQNGTANVNLGIGSATPHPYIWPSTGQFFIGNDGSPSLLVNTVSGNVGIGTSAPTAKLHINTAEAIPNLLLSAGSRDIATPTGETIQFGHWDGSTFTERMNIGPTGTLKVNGTIAAGNSYNDCPVGWGCNGQFWDISTSGLYYSVLQARSDKRLKKNIQKVSDEVLLKLLGLNPVTYEWRDPKIKGEKHGFIAQEVEDVMPELVATGSDKRKTKSVDYMQLISPLVKGFQYVYPLINEHDTKIEELDRTIASQKTEIEKLKLENSHKQQQLDEMKQAICEINVKAKICR